MSLAFEEAVQWHVPWALGVTDSSSAHTALNNSQSLMGYFTVNPEAVL